MKKEDCFVKEPEFPELVQVMKNILQRLKIYKIPLAGRLKRFLQAWKRLTQDQKLCF